MKKLPYLALLFMAWSIRSVAAEIVVIANANAPVTSLSKQQVQNLFMGRDRELPDGSYAVPLDYPELRSEFYTRLTKRPIDQVNAYWARLIFSGQTTPPKTINDEQALIKAVIDNRNTLAYVDKRSIANKPVKVLFQLE